MVIFIHGLYQTSSSFLPFIKELFGLNYTSSDGSDTDKMTDKFLLDTFCLNLSGYDLPDEFFGYKDIENNLLKSIENRHQAQIDIANKLILSSSTLPTSLLKDPKINIIGQDAGAICGLYFLANSSNLCKSLVIMDCGSSFSSIFDSVGYKLQSFWTKRLFSQSIDMVQSRYDQAKTIYDKNFLATMLHYPEHKGIKSYTKLLENYDFKTFFTRLSIQEQKDFSNTPILAIGNQKTGLCNLSSILKLPKIIDPTKKFINKKHTIISAKTSDPKFKIKIINSSHKNIVDPANFTQLSLILDGFYTG